MDLSTLAGRIDAGVLASGKSQAAVARLAGLPSRQTISRMKSGAMLGRPHLEAIARVLHCSVEWLTTGNGAAPSWATPSEQHAARVVAESATIYDAATASEAMRAMATENARLRAQLSDAQRRIDDLSETLTSAQSELSAIAARHSSATDRVAQLEARNSILRDRIAQLEARLRSPRREAR